MAERDEDVAFLIRLAEGADAQARAYEATDEGDRNPRRAPAWRNDAEAFRRIAARLRAPVDPPERVTEPAYDEWPDLAKRLEAAILSKKGLGDDAYHTSEGYNECVVCRLLWALTYPGPATITTPRRPNVERVSEQEQIEREDIADIISDYAIDFQSIPEGEGHAAWYIAGRILERLRVSEASALRPYVELRNALADWKDAGGNPTDVVEAVEDLIQHHLRRALEDTKGEARTDED